jgi:hypothetical protein
MKVNIILAVTFLICLLSTTAFSQCPIVGVPPYTSTLTSGGGDIDFELKRDERAGINDLIFYPDGFLKFRGRNFIPPVSFGSRIETLLIYSHSFYSNKKNANGAFPLTMVAIAVPKSTTSKTITAFYALSMGNCGARKVTIGPFNLDKVIWSSATLCFSAKSVREGERCVTDNSTAILCEAEGKRSVQVNTRTGNAIVGRKSRDNPCHK